MSQVQIARRRHGKIASAIWAIRRELHETDHRVLLVARSRGWADRVLEALDPHERERVDVSIPEDAAR